MAEIATGNRDDALDVVQDAMLKLVDNYSDRDPQAWAPLFYRILESRIRDWHRRASVRRRFFGWLRPPGDDDGDAPDPIASHPERAADEPERRVQADAMIDSLDAALRALPLRQQQVFLLRYWEGLDVKQTAMAMGVSTGSVKTHASRALAALRERLGAEVGEFDVAG